LDKLEMEKYLLTQIEILFNNILKM